jgi:translation initiation factor 2 subunit 3
MDKKEKLETINVGIVGHIDHGKTTLLQRLSGTWTDTHSEELKRGITIKLGYASAVISQDKGVYNISGKGSQVRHVSFVDAPGHEMLMATMLSGAAMMDAAVLVVAANEGIKPQTREHLMALQAKKIGKLIVVQNKIDLVTQEDAKKNYDDILEFLKKFHFENVEVIPVSAQQGVGIEEIWRAISDMDIKHRDESGDPVFVVARSFDTNKPGTLIENLKGAVLGGTLKKGILKIGDVIVIRPGLKIVDSGVTKYEEFSTKIRNLFVGSERVTKLTPGGSVGIETELDMALGKGDLLSGNVVGIKGKLPDLSSGVKVKYTLFEEVYGLTGSKGVAVEEVKASETLMLSIGTTITGGTVHKLKKGELEISLKVPAVVFPGDNVGIARNVGGHWRLIGYGEIL